MKIKIKKIVFIVVMLFLVAFVVSSCNDDNTAAYTDSPIIEAYLSSGQYFTIKISRQIPFSPDVAVYSDDDINNLQITLEYNGALHILTPFGDGNYIDSNIVVTASDEYNISFEFNGKTVTAYTYIPSKPIGLTQSVTSIEMAKIDSTSGFPGGGASFPEPVTISWENEDNSFYLIVVENIEADPEPIRELGDDDDRPEMSFRKTPTKSNTQMINAMEFEYFGTHRIIIYHVLPDYADLYEQNSTSSQNLENPSTSISNGYGIFTGLNSDTLYLEVIEE